jgi:hypothetical protein
VKGEIVAFGMSLLKALMLEDLEVYLVKTLIDEQITVGNYL